MNGTEITCSTASLAEGFMDMNFSELIDHIINTHHSYLYKVLPEVAQYIQEIENIYGIVHPELIEVRKLFTKVHMELLIHLPKEEMDMFPAIKKLELEPSVLKLQQSLRMIEALENEHESSDDILKQIREVTNNYVLPEGASNTYRLTFQKLQELESDMIQHIYLEDHILFPRVMNISM
jgi:regulator of cell morphogenesis and NO signaling